MKKFALIAAAAAFATATTATAGTYGDSTAPTTTVTNPVPLPAASSLSGPVIGLLLVGAVVAAASSGT